MPASCRFAFAIHILAVLACRAGASVTSQELARSVNTNPVVVRRLASSLRKAGFISTRKGSQPGCRLTRAPEEIPLDEVYRAVERGIAFGEHPQEPSQCCHVGRKIQEALRDVFVAAEEALESALARRTLADVVEQVAEPAEKPRRGRVRSAPAAHARPN